MNFHGERVYLSMKSSTAGIWYKCIVILSEEHLIISKDDNGKDGILFSFKKSELKSIKQIDRTSFCIYPVNGKNIILYSRNQNDIKEWHPKIMHFIGEKQINLSFHDFVIIAKIGSGFTSNVYLAQNKASNDLVALKTVNKSNTEHLDSLEREEQFIKTLASPFIIKIKCVVESSIHRSIGLEYMMGGDLFFRIKKYGIPSEKDTKIILSEIVCALDSIHSSGFIYRDLKPENVLIDANGHIRLADFGFCVEADEFMGTGGTLSYMAPEVLNREKYTNKIDIWSFGVLMYELIFNEVPFVGKSKEEIIKKILWSNPTFPREIPKETKNIILQCLSRNPNHRPLIKDIKSFPYFRGINWENVETKQQKLDSIPMVDPGKLPINFDPSITKTRVDNIVL